MSEVPLLGRDRELRRLDDCVRRVLEGRAAVVAIGGEAGLGKSRLGAETLVRARGAGFAALRGSGGPLQRDLSYAPLVEALRPLVRGPAATVAALVDGLSDLARLFDGLPVARPTQLGDAGLERTRLFEAVCTLLRRASGQQPLAVLLDDAHWVDSGSLALLHYLVRGLADRPVLFVLTYRSGEQERDLRDLLLALRCSDVLAEIDLRPLGPDAVGGLARALLAGEPPAALLDLLAGRAGGVPLFVKALVDSMVEAGSLVRSGGRWVLRSDDLDAVPPVVGDLVRERIEGLPRSARAVLESLAIFGGRVAHAVLREIAADEAVLLDGVSRLRTLSLIDEELADGTVTYRVSHPLLGEVAYDLLPAVTRAERHAAAARAVQRVAPADLRGLAAQVRRAGDVLDAEVAFDVLRRAAGEALAAKRGEEAAADLRAALATAARLDRTDVAAELLALLGEASELAGRTDDARVAWLAAADRAGHDPATRARCLTRAATAEWDRGHLREAESHLDLAGEVLAGLPAGEEHLAVAEARLRSANRRGDATAWRRLIADLDRLAEQTGSERARVVKDTYRLAAALVDGDFRSGLGHIGDVLLGARRLRDPVLMEWVCRPALALQLCRGDLVAAREHATEGLNSALASGVPTLETVHRVHLGFVDLLAGRLDEALAVAFDAHDLAQRIGTARGAAYALSLQGFVLVRRGRFDDAATRVAEARGYFGRSPDMDQHVFSFVDLAEVQVMLGRGDAMAAARLAADVTARRPTCLTLAFGVLGDAALATGDIETARTAVKRLGELDAPYPAALALRLQGRVTRDPGACAEAADGFAAMGMVYDEVVTRLDRAELVAEPSLAVELGRCVEVLDRLRAQPQADRARNLLRRLGERPPPRAVQGRPSGLSTREEEVARLVAQGLSNADVAKRLFISQRTVTTHLRNIYARLELGSRTALTRYVLERLNT